MSEPFVVIGGDAAGMSAASKARREAPDRDIVVFERGKWVSYGACGLPYYVKGEIETLEDLVSVPAEAFREKRNIDLRTDHEVVEIDAENERVVAEGPEGIVEQQYGDLLIATGASAIVPPIDGSDLPGVFTLHSLDDGKAIRTRIEEGGIETVGIVGGGYVGVEMAEAFQERVRSVHLFEQLPQVLAPFGSAVGRTVAEELREKGLRVHLETPVDRFEGKSTIESIQTPGGTHEVDLALLAVGVSPNVSLASEAGIEIGSTGAIATDKYGETSNENVFAAGDVAEMTHVVTGEPVHVPLALTANRAGRAIGQTVTGSPEPVGPIAGTATLKAFDLEAGRTGLTEEEKAKAAGYEPVSISITTESRAGYYPGGEEIQITLLGDTSTGAVLGASMVGKEGVAKRIDTIATALHAGVTVEELERLDLSYAPPFGPTWDPVLTAGKVLRGSME
ncbi:MAG: FAD-dependent oxidoreductase [Halodesulfurarchaeum sp.]